jgi:hypothetical protein
MAQFNLGVMKFYGRGVVQDHAEAFKWYLMAAEQGKTNAKINVGSMYSKGEGVLRDFDQAYSWFLKAASEGHALAQRNLGVMYAKGIGVPQDPIRSYVWFSASEALGDKISTARKIALLKELNLEDITEVQVLAQAYIDKYVEPFR